MNHHQLTSTFLGIYHKIMSYLKVPGHALLVPGASATSTFNIGNISMNYEFPMLIVCLKRIFKYSNHKPYLLFV